jgi:cytochrome c oxidase cbb3-type subunit III
MRGRSFVAIMVALMIWLSACENMPGRPKAGPEVPRPEDIRDFATLYSQNCAGCHGTDGQMGPATPLNNPEYQALVDDPTFTKIIAEGQKGTMMPGFARSAGGNLTDPQVSVLVEGMRARWFKGKILAGLNAPPYQSDRTGDAAHGKQVYEAQCARCHGASSGAPGPKGAILDGSFLALISDQTIRTTAIVGRPDLGMPDWRNRTPGNPMSAQDVADVVAWLVSQRPQAPGQPYPQQQKAATSGSPSIAQTTSGAQ